MGLFDMFSKKKTEDKPEGKTMPIIPIDSVVCVELVFVATTFSRNEREGLEQEYEKILCAAWPELFPLILDRNPKGQFRFGFVSSQEEALIQINTTHKELGSNLVFQPLRTIEISFPPEDLRDYGITLGLHLATDPGSVPVIVTVAPNHTLVPGSWRNAP